MNDEKQVSECQMGQRLMKDYLYNELINHNDVSEKIMLHYYKQLGYDIKNLSENKIHCVKDLGGLMSVYTKKIKGGYFMAYDWTAFGYLNSEFCNRNDILNAIIHEEIHLQKRLKNIPAGETKDDPIRKKEEGEAFRTQVLDKTWHDTSLTFKQAMYDGYGKNPEIFNSKNLQKYFFNYGVEQKKN